MHVQAIELHVHGFGVSVSGFGSRVSGFGLRVWGSEFRVSGFEFRVSGFEFRVSGLGFRDEGVQTSPDSGAHLQAVAARSAKLHPTARLLFSQSHGGKGANVTKNRPRFVSRPVARPQLLRTMQRKSLCVSTSELPATLKIGSNLARQRSALARGRG